MLRQIIVSIRDWYLVHVKWRRYSMGKNFHAGRNVVLWAKKLINIGNNCYIGRNSQIECNIEIGNNVLIGNNVAFVGKYDHNYTEVGVSIRNAEQIRNADYSWEKGLNSTTKVGDDVWIGYGSIVLSGVIIADGCIIGAGSVVTKDTEEYSIYAGVPAKKITDRFQSSLELNEHKMKIKID